MNEVSPVGTCRLDIAPVQCTSGVDSVNRCGLDLPPKLERGMSTAVKMMGNTSCLRHLQKYRPDVHFDLLLKCWDFHTAGESTRITVGRLERECFSNSHGRLPLACISTINDPRHRQGTPNKQDNSRLARQAPDRWRSRRRLQMLSERRATPY